MICILAGLIQTKVCHPNAQSLQVGCLRCENHKRIDQSWKKQSGEMLTFHSLCVEQISGPFIRDFRRNDPGLTDSTVPPHVPLCLVQISRGYVPIA